jgi:hypothetical protein
MAVAREALVVIFRRVYHVTERTHDVTSFCEPIREVGQPEDPQTHLRLGHKPWLTEIQEVPTDVVQS